MKTRLRIVLAFMLVALSACGGGGGSDGGASMHTESNSSPTPTTINSSNYQSVVGQSAGSFNVLDGVQASAIPLAPSGTVFDVALEQALSAQAALVTSIRTGAPVSILSYCDVDPVTSQLSGTSTLSSNIITLNGLVGGTISAEPVNCLRGSRLINGTTSLTYKSVSGDPVSTYAWSGAVSLALSGFSIDYPNASPPIFTGTMTGSVNQTDQDTISYTLAGDSLQILSVSNGVLTSSALNDFSYAGEIAGRRSSYSINFKLTGPGSALTVKTITPFRRDSTGFPTEGSLVVQAADHSTATLTVINSTNIEIDLDKDGNGVSEESKTLTWSSLLRT